MSSLFFFNNINRIRITPLGQIYLAVIQELCQIRIILHLFAKKNGCPGRARTSDKLINSQPLYQLSYWAKCSYRKNPTLSLEDLESLLLSVGAHSPNIVWKKLRFLTMPSLTNTVAGTLTLPLKETICIVLSFDCSTL